MVAKIFEVSALCKQVAKCNRCFVAHGLALHISSSLRGGDRRTKPAQTRHMCETNPKAHMSIRQQQRARRTQCVKLLASVLTSYIRSGRIGSADRSEARISFHLRQADV